MHIQPPALPEKRQFNSCAVLHWRGDADRLGENCKFQNNRHYKSNLIKSTGFAFIKLRFTGTLITYLKYQLLPEKCKDNINLTASFLNSFLFLFAHTLKNF